MPDSAPIRGRWTIHHTSGTQTHTLRFLNALVDGPPIAAMSDAVEVVPVPDEAAIERGAKAHEERDGARIGWHSETNTYAVYFPNDEVVPGYDSPKSAAADVDRLVALAVLRAALETSIPPIPTSDAQSAVRRAPNAQVPPEAQ
jgi:hypothetical protein